MRKSKAKPFACCQHWNHLRMRDDGRLFCECVTCGHSWF